jgi:Domain of unknown function (DUF4383)
VIRIFAILFGIAYIFVGVLGFLPTYKTDGLLFGYLNAGYMHNMINIIAGVIAIMAATNLKLSTLFFRAFGIVFLVIAIWGFWSGGDLYIMQIKLADSIIHLLVSLLSLYIGFFMGNKEQIN